MKHQFDIPDTIEVRRCARGFMASTGDRYVGSIGLAAWLVEQYAQVERKPSQV